MTSYLILVPVVLLFLNLLRLRYSKGLNKFDGPFLASFTDLWKVWYAYHNSQKKNDIYVDIHKKYGDVVRIGPNNLSFADPRAIQDIYGTHGSAQKSEMYQVTASINKGVRTQTLLSSTDGRWHDKERRMVNSAFTLSSILKYEPWVNDSIGVFLRQMSERFVGKDGPQGIIDLHKWDAFFTADVISNLTYGQRTGFMETGVDIQGIHEGVRMVFRPWLYSTRWPILDKLTFKNPLLVLLSRLGIMELTTPLVALVGRHFDERKQVWENEKGTSSDRETLVDRFIMLEKEQGENMQISPKTQAFSMVVAGSETTAITLSSVFYLLLKNPRCYSKLQAEIDAVPDDKLDNAPDGQVFPWAVSQTLPYLDACVREAMRVHVVQRMPHDRVVPSTGLEICGHQIPAGTDVGIYAPVLHRRTEVFGKDADAYRPERWLEDEERTKHMKNSMFTFSYGKYNCLGKNISRMEMYKFIPSVLRRYELSFVDPNSEWTLLPGAFAIPTEIYVRMSKR